jgi:hypothetical protein
MNGSLSVRADMRDVPARFMFHATDLPGLPVSGWHRKTRRADFQRLPIPQSHAPLTVLHPKPALKSGGR